MRAWFNPNLESRWFFLPGIDGILTLLPTMLVTPLRPVEILIGKNAARFSARHGCIQYRQLAVPAPHVLMAGLEFELQS